MNLQDWAALMAIIDFAGRVWRRIWKHQKKPIQNFLSSIIDGVVSFLTRIKRHLDDSEDKEDFIVNGVTGGSFLKVCVYLTKEVPTSSAAPNRGGIDNFTTTFGLLI